MSDAARARADTNEAPLERFDMRANFEGLIQLLARNLYPEPDVFVRELIQNAHDSIRRRQLEQPGHAGRIEIEVNRDDSTIVFRDDGIGMDREDIHEFLSVIGSTGTGTARARLEDADSGAAFQLVGQFGIGMLSAFVVADRVTVSTRKLGEDDAFVWENEGRTECVLKKGAREAPGSEITVSVGRTHAYMLDSARIREAIIRYCDFLPYPIYLDGRGPVNTVQAPWDRPGWPSEGVRDAAYREFVGRRYPDVALEVIPVEIEEPVRARGALYISDRRIPDFNTAGVVDIFVRRMFVRGGDTDILPEWAKFVRGVIECPDLQPTAARDNVRRDGWAYTALRERLAGLILDRLTHLAEHRPERFREINRWHHYHLKGMAFYHDDFRERVGGLLLYETNRGLLPLQDLFAANNPPRDADPEAPWGSGGDGWGTNAQAELSDEWAAREARDESPVYFFSDDGSAPQFYRLADARGWLVANAGHVFEEELLARYGRTVGASHRLVRLDDGLGSALFRPPAPGTSEQCETFERAVEAALRAVGLDHVGAQVCRFEPEALPAMVLLSPESEAELELEALVQQPWFMESLRGVTEEVLKRRERRPLQLHINQRNPLVRALLERLTAKTPRSALVGLFVGAALNARNLLTRRNVEILHDEVQDLVAGAAGLALSAATDDREKGGSDDAHA